MVKNQPAVQEMRVPSLGQEEPLEKEMATHSCSCLGNTMDTGAWRATAHVTKKLISFFPDSETYTETDVLLHGNKER